MKYNKNQIFFISLFLLSLTIYSQKTVIDLVSKEPIRFVEMYSENGDLLGTTDYNGKIPEFKLNKTKKLEIAQVYFHHNNYKVINISINTFLNSDNISMTPLETEKLNALDEVVVFSKNNKKHIKFTAYFRNIQFNNFQPQYYMDGIVEYYIANKNGKAKICVLQNRSLKNTTIKQLDEKGLVRFNFNMTGVPNLEDFIDFEKLKKEYQIDKLDTSYSFIEDGIEIGKIEEEKDNLVLNLQIYSIEKPKIMKLFGIESVLKGYTVNTIYNKTEDPNILQDLLYFKEYREYDIKQKKDKNYTYINCINEVFIIDREYTDNEPPSKDSFYSFIDKSNYEKPFWENIKNGYIAPLSQTVEEFIKNKLSE